MNLPVSLNPDPSQDGITHINVWSKGRTQLGQLLSNFAHVGFNHPVHGYFASVEGFWYWLSTGRTHDELRRLYGASAKSVGSKLEQVPIPEDEFREGILEALRCKIEQNPDIAVALKNSHLPLEHYFVYGHNVIVNQGQKHGWQLQFLQMLRHELQGGPKVVDALNMVEMADGTWKSPAELQVGDQVKVHDTYHTLTVGDKMFTAVSEPGYRTRHNVPQASESAVRQWSGELREHLIAQGLEPVPGTAGGMDQYPDGSVRRWSESDP